MIDLAFEDALYWVFMNTLFVKLLGSGLTFIALIVSVFLIIRKWGDAV